MYSPTAKTVRRGQCSNVLTLVRNLMQSILNLSLIIGNPAVIFSEKLQLDIFPKFLNPNRNNVIKRSNISIAQSSYMRTNHLWCKTPDFSYNCFVLSYILYEFLKVN